MKSKNRSKYLHENIIKNLLLLAVSIGSFPFIKERLQQIPTSGLTDILTVIAVMLVFGATVNFAFSYEKVRINSSWERLLGHLTTFIAMMILVLVIESIIILVQIAYPAISTFLAIIGILSMACILLYDFWDLLRYEGFKS